MEKIELIKFTDRIDDYKLMHKWCNEKFVYEWFEQRALSLEEIIIKYKSKLLNKKQKLYFIKYNGIKIGFVQIYEYVDRKNNKFNDYDNIYEYDIFIGEIGFLSKGIGTKVIDYVNKYIYKNYQADCIVLRSFKRNTRAIKCYQKNGFNIINEYNGIDTIGNEERIVVLINKRDFN